MLPLRLGLQQQQQLRLQLRNMRQGRNRHRLDSLRGERRARQADELLFCCHAGSQACLPALRRGAGWQTNAGPLTLSKPDGSACGADLVILITNVTDHSCKTKTHASPDSTVAAAGCVSAGYIHQCQTL